MQPQWLLEQSCLPKEEFGIMDFMWLIVAELIEEGADSVTGHILDNVSLQKISRKF